MIIRASVTCEWCGQSGYKDIEIPDLPEKPKEPESEDLIAFAMWLTGHDEETIKQLYKDWK